MKQLRPVVWSKGVLLTPQHMQVQDRFIESVMSFHMDSLSYQPWGFKDLQINRESLSKGLFAISRASGILPDGLLFSMPDADAPPDSRRIVLEKDQNSIDVYLAIPQHLERGTNVSQNGSAGAPASSNTRYRAEVHLVRDENSGGSERPVHIAHKNFRLLTADDSHEGSVTMRIARVRRGSTANSLELDPGFVPPLVDVAGSHYLETIVQRLVEIMSGRSATLGGLRRQNNQSLAEFSAADIPNFWLLYTVNTYLPLLRHIVETRKGHPTNLFDTMLAMAGALTTFSPNIQPRDFPLYDHNELGDCFRKLDETLRTLLDSVVPVNFVSLPLKLDRNFVYATSLADDKYLLSTRMYLAFAADMPEADILRLVPKLLKISSGDRVEQLMSQALEGVGLTHSPAPSEIPVKMKYQYFALNQSGKEWEAVRRARNVAAYVPDNFISPQMELWILLPKSEREPPR